MSRYLLATRQEAEDATERLRMCFAEAGFVDGVHGVFSIEKVIGRYAIVWHTRLPSGDPPKRVRWRGRETAMIGSPLCLRHFGAVDVDDCESAAWFTEDCEA